MSQEEFDSCTRVEQRKGKESGDGSSRVVLGSKEGTDSGGAGERKTLERDFPRLLLLSLWYEARVVLTRPGHWYLVLRFQQYNNSSIKYRVLYL